MTAAEEHKEHENANHQNEPEVHFEDMHFIDDNDEVKEKAEPAKENYGTDDKKSTRFMVVSILSVITIILLILSITYFYNPAQKISTGIVKTKSSHPTAETGSKYIYSGIEFSRKNDFWYADLKTANTVYSTEFYYGPREIENIPVEGKTFGEKFQKKELYVTFNPYDSNMTFIALAIGQLDTHLVKTFQKNLIAACTDENATGCFSRPVITCANATDTAVIYVKQAELPKITFEGNCVMIEGREWDIVKAAENVLMRAYAIIK